MNRSITPIRISAAELTERGFDPGLAEALAKVLETGASRPRDLALIDAAADLLFDRG